MYIQSYVYMYIYMYMYYLITSTYPPGVSVATDKQDSGNNAKGKKAEYTKSIHVNNER